MLFPVQELHEFARLLNDELRRTVHTNEIQQRNPFVVLETKKRLEDSPLLWNAFSRGCRAVRGVNASETSLKAVFHNVVAKAYHQRTGEMIRTLNDGDVLANDGKVPAEMSMSTREFTKALQLRAAT
jgi:hypothetical protein